MTNPQGQGPASSRTTGGLRNVLARLRARSAPTKLVFILKAIILGICAVVTVVLLVGWRDMWVDLQKNLTVGGGCLALAEQTQLTSESEAIALGFAGASFAVLPVVLFSKSSTELAGAFFALISTASAFVPSSGWFGLEGATRVAVVVSSGVLSLAVFIIGYAYRRAVELDTASKPRPKPKRGYEARFWDVLPQTVTATVVVIAIAIAVPLGSPLGSPNVQAQDTVKQHLEDLTKYDTTRCGGGLTEPKPGPTKG